MKNIIIAATMLLATNCVFGQTDTTQPKESTDTLKVGNFIIIKKGKPSSTFSADTGIGNKDINININICRNKEGNKNRCKSSTNYLVFDLGFANYRDNTNYAAAQNKGYINPMRPVTANSMGLNGGKSSNVNIWFVMQKRDLIKQVLNLKYGVGLEMYNFRFNSNISYRNTPIPTVFMDSISFSKDKLYAGYLTAPLMLNLNTRSYKNDGLSLSAGVSAGYLVSSRNKQISTQRGKEKYKGTLDLAPWRLAAVGEIGLGGIRLYGSYSLNRLHKESTGLDQYPYAVGIRFSKW